VGVKKRITKRVEHAIVKCLSKASPLLLQALNEYRECLRKRKILGVEDYRIRVTSIFPHVLISIPLLGSSMFNIKRLAFRVRRKIGYELFEDKVRILFSGKIIIPSFSLTLASFATIQRWVSGDEQTYDKDVDSDKVQIIKEGHFSILNFYYFRSMEALDLSRADTTYLDTILNNILHVVTPLSMPTVKNKHYDLIKVLPFSSIYGTGISGVEVLYITRCILKVNHSSLLNSRRVNLKTMLWGTLPVHKVRANVLSYDLLNRNFKVTYNENIYVPELYFDKLLEIFNSNDERELLIDSIILSLFMVRRREVLLFNILSVPLEICYVDDENSYTLLVEHLLLSRYSSASTDTLYNPSNGYSWEVNINLSEKEVTTEIQQICRMLSIRNLNAPTSSIKLRIPRLNQPIETPLCYAYVLLHPSLVREGDVMYNHKIRYISLTCLSPYIAVPLMAYSLLKGLPLSEHREIATCLLKTLGKRYENIDIIQLTELRNALSKKLGENIGYEEVIFLIRNAMFARNLNASKIEYLSKIQNLR